MILYPPAKLNLYLEVIGKRKDGYHLLDSLIVFTNITDKIQIKPATKFLLSVNGPFAKDVADNQDNIISKAVNIMAEKCHHDTNIAINLEKNIPTGAGLGGGSADAAATLLALNKLWQVNLSDDELVDIAVKLGADVPVFIKANAACVSGIGEFIDPVLNMPPLYAVLIYPYDILSTKEIFSNLKIVQSSNKKNNSTKDLLKLSQNSYQDWHDFLIKRENHLEVPARKILPQIADIIINLQKNDDCLLARMTGSGSTCFAIFDQENKAIKAAEYMKQQYPEFWVEKTQIIYKIFD